MSLNNVENTKLSTWTGSTAITTLGTISTGTIPWANVSGKPSQATTWPNWGQILQNGANNIEEGTSDFTDNTEILSSYASNNGFADTNASGKVYRRDAIKLYNYIKGKTDSLYATVGHNHDSTYVNVGGDTMTGELINQSGGIWVQGGSAAGSNSGRMTLTSGMPVNLAYNTSKRGTRIYSNAIAFADPYNGNSNNDAGWIRHIEETANTGILEIATGDDAQEKIVVRQYNTSSTVTNEMILLDSSGYTHTKALFTPIIELSGMSASANHGGYIDFHWNNNSADYTSRIIESSSGFLSFNVSNGMRLFGTGSFHLDQTNINASLANNNISSMQYPAFYVNDNAARILMRNEAVINPNGDIGAYWYVRNYNTSGDTVAQKGIKMTMNKSGTLTWAVDEAASFRTAIGLGNVNNQTITVTSTSVSDGTNTFSKYTHPTTAGNKHIPAGGSSGQFLGYDSAGTAKWVANPNTDKAVLQTSTNSNHWRKVLVGYQYDANPNVAVTNQTNQVYASPNLEFKSQSGTLKATEYSVNGNATLQYNSTTESLDFVF